MTKKSGGVVEGEHKGAARKKFHHPTRGAKTGQLRPRLVITCYDCTWRVLAQCGVHVFVHRGRVTLTRADRNALSVRLEIDA